MSPQLAAGLTAFVGICLLAGWITGFRHRSYVGLLGLAFLGLSAFLVTIGKVREAQDLGSPDPGLARLARGLLFLWIGALLLAAVSAVRETGRRLREIKEAHLAAAEGLMEMMRAARSQETGEEQTAGPPPPEGGDAAPGPGADDAA